MAIRRVTIFSHFDSSLLIINNNKIFFLLPQCPLCIEPFEMDDKDFVPCPCGYRICLFCWNRLANQEDNTESGKSVRGPCPACRQEYPERPVSFNSNLTSEQFVKNKKKKKQSKLKSNQQEKSKPIVLRRDDKNLAGLRVVQKNLVFIIGIPTRLSQDDLK